MEALKFVIKRSLFDQKVYNVGTANATLGEIVEAIAKPVPDLSVEYVDSPVRNQLPYEVDRSRFTKLGFQFRGSLEAGIADAISLLRGTRQR